MGGLTLVICSIGRHPIESARPHTWQQLPSGCIWPGQHDIQSFMALASAKSIHFAMTSEAPINPSKPRPILQWLRDIASGDAAVVAAAQQGFEEMLAEDPKNGVARMGLGIGHAMAGRLDEARAQFEASVAADPKLAAAWSNLGNIHKLQGRLKPASVAYEKAIALDPALADAHYNLAQILDAQGQANKAEEALKRALLFRPAYGEAHNNLGHMLLKRGKVEEACSHLRQALVFQPQLRPARFNLVLALYRLGRGVEAQAQVDQLLAESPDDPQVLRVQAAGLAQQGRLDDAEAVNRQLMAREPDAADLQFNLAEVLLSRDDHEAALAVYKELLAKRSVPPAVVIGAMAQVNQAQGKYSEAQNLFRQALMSDGTRAMLALGLARSQITGGDVRLGLEALRRAAELAPDAADIHALLVDQLRLEPSVSDAARADEWNKWRHRHAKGGGSRQRTPSPRARHTTGDALRVGLLVGDISPGATRSMLEALAAMPRTQDLSWHVYACMAPGPSSQALIARFEHWRPVASLGADDLCEQWRSDGIDVLVDTIGLGAGNRALAMTRQAARLQVGWGAWLGGEVPKPPVDAILADATVLPTAKWALRTVFPWHRPDAPVLSDPQIDARPGFVFGAVAKWSHIQAPVLDAWAQILTSAPQARLVLVSDIAESDALTLARLSKLLALREVDPARVECRPRDAAPSLAPRLSGIDCVLDTFRSPMGQAAFDILAVGVPVLTLAGTQGWERSTASVLVACGMDGGVATSVKQYIEMACAAAASGPLGKKARQGVQAATLQAPATDPQAWAKDFVSALRRASA